MRELADTGGYEDWKRLLDFLGDRHDWDTQGPEWREYYDEGKSPMDAIREDMHSSLS